MDKSWWREIASFWVTIRSAAEKEKTTLTAETLFEHAINSRQEEQALVDLLKRDIDEEDDDDGY